ncbi:MAG: bifunctional (p)ppGpp synthetase/guanosine-3',5'-bis(diphosphate) 3'-pyrophosphohydrolase, partial [Anaerolineales bacterium]|nr:bifunctional (p)ppGpp synthetase/guanosine-3',5'-bis(diphosphate) 3'-pyrophosphohydrolase [Anaerolineales bacterium]
MDYVVEVTAVTLATKHLNVNHTDKPLPSLTSLQNLIAYYMSPADRYLVERAIETAVSIHDGYFRKSGVPYIDHVLAVATILASWHAPADVVIAGLFHDVLKSRYANVPDLTALETNFGTVSIRLVRDTARLGRLGPLLSADQPDTKGDVMQQLPWVAMVLQRSPLAVVIKLADKLHNFQSLHFLSQKRQRAFANSVLR